jgi:CO/xanthine dehydrogenase FAD-binding subunit
MLTATGPLRRTAAPLALGAAPSLGPQRRGVETSGVETPKISRPRHLREALGLAFVHRGRIRWRAGASRFLGLEYPGVGEGVVVDVRDVPDFREIRSDRSGLQIGAFADLERVAREPLIRSALGEEPFGPDAARFRLAALGAKLVIAATGTTRTVGLGTLAERPLPPNEIPLAVTLGTALPKVAFGDRRIRRRDGAATFELRVFVALGIAGFHRIGEATVAYTLDGGPPVALTGARDALAGAMIARRTFGAAAHRAADAFGGEDEKTSVLRRTIVPLVLSALNDAYHASRALPPAI